MYNTIQIYKYSNGPSMKNLFLAAYAHLFTHQQFLSEVRGPTTNCTKTGLSHWIACTIQGSADQIANIKQE